MTSFRSNTGHTSRSAYRLNLRRVDPTPTTRHAPPRPHLSFAGLEDIRREALVERLVARRRAPGEEAVASGCAGATSNFVTPPSSSTNVRVVWPNKPDQEQEPAGDVYTAENWKFEDVRVENPEDSEQYVNTKRILQAWYRRPDGTTFQIDNRPIFAVIDGE